VVTVVDVEGTWVNDAAVEWDAGELRLADAAAFGGRGDTYGAKGGIVQHSTNSLLVSVDGADLVTVQPGSVVIAGSAVAGTGVYRSGIAAPESASLDARDGTNPRIDLVVFRQLDTDVVGGHGAYTARIEIITGVPGAVPAVPALPSMAEELARITVPQTGGGAATVNLTRRSFSVALGGILPVPTKVALPAAAALFQRAIALDTGIEYIWDGTAWAGDWVNLTSALTTCRYRRTGSIVHVQVNGSGTFAAATELALSTSAIPSGLRPSVNARAGAYFDRHPGTIVVAAADGMVTGWHQSGAARPNVSAIFSYPLG